MESPKKLLYAAVNIQFVPFILRAWIIALSQSKYIRKKKCKINIWSLTHESFFLYEASNFTLSRSEYTLLYYISNDSLLCWNHLKSFLRGLCHFSIHGLASLKNFWDHFLSIWLQIKKDYMQIVTKLIIPGKGSQKYGIDIQVVSFHHFKSLNRYTEPMKILPVVVRIIRALQSSLTKQLNFHQHLGGLTVSSLAFRWEGHGFESHSVPSLKWKKWQWKSWCIVSMLDGNCGA